MVEGYNALFRCTAVVQASDSITALTRSFKCFVSFSCSVVSYLYVSCSRSITSFGEERELIFLLSFICNYVVSVMRGFLFLLGLAVLFHCVTHSMGLPYDYISLVT